MRLVAQRGGARCRVRSSQTILKRFSSAIVRRQFPVVQKKPEHPHPEDAPVEQGVCEASRSGCFAAAEEESGGEAEGEEGGGGGLGDDL